MCRIFVVDNFPFVCVGWNRSLLNDVGPFSGILAIEIEPWFGSVVGVREDCFGRAFRLAYPAVDAFVRMDHQHVLPLVKAIDGANLDAIHVFALDAGLADNERHDVTPSSGTTI
jgi:hypothetical protein